jgi:alkanesulfonate monooxygenase SsuD/methylene tetrahydromethanopterin reductase-like flavin-dependent oxidoreductase (luciferase family)
MGLDEHRAKLRVLEEHCQDAGRDPSGIEVTHNTRVLIAENNTEFEKLAARHASSSNMSLREYQASLTRAIAGTPERCAEQIQQYVDQGITYFFLLFPEPIQPESLELFAREVMPNFNSASG